MANEIRQKRVTGLLLEELTILVGNELNDPRLSLVTVTDVIVSKDLHNVRVFVSHDDEGISRREVMARLNKAAPFLRSQVGERLSLRFVPELSFAYDESPARIGRIQELLQQIANERAEHESLLRESAAAGDPQPATEGAPDAGGNPTDNVGDSAAGNLDRNR